MPPTPFINFAFLVGSFRSIICEIDSSGGKQVFFCCDTGEIGGYTRLVFVTLVDLVIRNCDRKNIKHVLKTTCKNVTFWSLLVRGGNLFSSRDHLFGDNFPGPSTIWRTGCFFEGLCHRLGDFGWPKGIPKSRLFGTKLSQSP